MSLPRLGDITQTTNYTTFSSSLATVDSGQNSRLNSIESVTGSYATTGSNTFVGIQAISDTTNSTSYLDGALTVAGGLSVRKDVRVSGSMTVNGLLTAVSMSTQYVTSSQYNIGVSKITLNDDDNVRFAGLSIYDSGSSSPATASIFWDSLQDRFIYENLSGSTYNSAILIAGPRNYGTLGDEVGLTDYRIPVAHGSDHIDSRLESSSIRIDFPSRLTHIEAGLQVTGAISASNGINAGNGLFGTLQTAAQTNITSVGTLSSLTVSGNLTVDTNTLYVDAANNRVGIGTASPSYRADIENTGGSTAALRVYGNDQANVRLRLENVGSGGRVFELVGGVQGVANNAFTLYDATAAATRLTVDASGNLGLGVTPSGGYKLEVNGIVLASVIEIGEMSAFLSNSTNAAIGWASSFSGYDNGTLILQPRSSAARPIVFATGNTTPTERMRLDASGNLAVDTNTLYVDAANNRVGIGTASPASLLNLHAAAPELIVNGTGVSY